MSHLSDKELDRLSREAAEQFDVEGSTSGWDALEKKLNSSMPADAPVKRRRRGLWYWLSGSVLLITLLGYYTFFREDRKSSFEDQNELVLPEQKSSGSNNPNNLFQGNSSKKVSTGTVPAGKNSTEIQIAEETNKNLETVSDKDGQQTKGSSKTILGKAIQQTKRSSESISGLSGKNNKSSNSSNTSTNSTTSKNEIIRTEIFEGNILKPVYEKDSKVVVENITGIKFEEFDFIRQPSLPIIQHQHSLININASTHADSMIANLANAATPERDTSVKSTTIFPFEIGMIVGSDMSNVNFQGNDRIGLNFGIYVGYRINKRWLINTGLIHDKKYYNARGKDFHPPKGYWTDYVKLDMVAGDCSMWEIPLNVRYDLSLARKGNWFVSGGLSTYLMQQEDYDYHYWTNGNFYTLHKGYPSKEKSILGILNLSGGFERNFTPHVSLQIEPYMRIPLKGVGFGNMQMNSFGTNFILKFKSGPAKK